MKKIRVVVLGTRGFPNVQGGIEVHCQNLYTQLVRLGCEVIVLARSPYVDREIHRYEGVTIAHIGAIRHRYLEAFLHTFLGVFRALMYKPDILHIHAIGPSFFIPIARLLGMKVVFTTHGPDYKHLKWNRPAKIFLRLCERIGVMTANRIIGVSKSISEDMSTMYGRKAIYIPNGVSRLLAAHDSEILNDHGLERQKYILSVGRLVPSKGFADLIESFSIVQKYSIPDWKLVIAGGADHEDAYSKALKKLARKNKNIILTGPVIGKHLGALYMQAGLFVLPSYYEGLSLALIEAMSCGLSCIASSIPANREVGLSEDRFFTPGDIAALAEKLHFYVLGTFDEEEKKRQADFIRKKYDWVRIARQTLQVYEDVCRS